MPGFELMEKGLHMGRRHDFGWRSLSFASLGEPRHGVLVGSLCVFLDEVEQALELDLVVEEISARCRGVVQPQIDIVARDLVGLPVPAPFQEADQAVLLAIYRARAGRAASVIR